MVKMRVSEQDCLKLPTYLFDCLPKQFGIIARINKDRSALRRTGEKIAVFGERTDGEATNIKIHLTRCFDTTFLVGLILRQTASRCQPLVNTKHGYLSPTGTYYTAAGARVPIAMSEQKVRPYAPQPLLLTLCVFLQKHTSHL